MQPGAAHVQLARKSEGLRHPRAARRVTRELERGDCHIQLDLTPQVLLLDLPRDSAFGGEGNELRPTCSRTTSA